MIDLNLSLKLNSHKLYAIIIKIIFNSSNIALFIVIFVKIL